MSLFHNTSKKTFLVVIALLIVSMFVLAACAPANAVAQKVVELPGALQSGIAWLAVFAVGWLFAQIGAVLPWFTNLFGKYADEIAFALSGALIGTIQNWLNMIPPAWEEVGNIALMLVVAVLSALQVFRLFGKARVRTFRA